jgi:RNA polymerase sigma factor (TIGR02999 family)
MSDLAHILRNMDDGDANAAHQWLPCVYSELRRLAAFKMAQEAPGQTLQPTALVHEAWLRLVSRADRTFQNRTHFFNAAGEAMRRILIERARRRRSLRHGGGQQRVGVEGLEVAALEDDELLLAVNEALDQFAAEDPVKAAVVKLRFFAGLSDRQVGEALGLSERTVERYWAYSKSWLFRKLRR